MPFSGVMESTMPDEHGQVSYSVRELLERMNLKLDRVEESLKERVTTSYVDTELSDIRNHIEAFEARISDVERQTAVHEGICSYKKWVIGLIIGVGVSLLFSLVGTGLQIIGLVLKR